MSSLHELARLTEGRAKWVAAELVRVVDTAPFTDYARLLELAKAVLYLCRTVGGDAWESDERKQLDTWRVAAERQLKANGKRKARNLHL